MKKYFGHLALVTIVLGSSIAWAARDIKWVSEALANDLYFYPICAGIAFIGIYCEGIAYKVMSVYFGWTFVLFFIYDFILHKEAKGIYILTGGFLLCTIYLLFRRKA